MLIVEYMDVRGAQTDILFPSSRTRYESADRCVERYGGSVLRAVLFPRMEGGRLGRDGMERTDDDSYGEDAIDDTEGRHT